MSFRRRTYPEVLENLLTAMTRGVAAESHGFPPEHDPGDGTWHHHLLKPEVAHVVSVHGAVHGEPHRFSEGTDYELVESRTLVWTGKGALPDRGTLFQVCYYPQTALPVLTDLQTGSVVRTINETVALEVARLYAQLEAVYHAGFIDHAAGAELEKVVALLGVARIPEGRATGDLLFTRARGTTGNITISAGTRVITEDGRVEYETVGEVTMAAGQGGIRVEARDLETNEGLPADSLTVLPAPIEGIAGVTNPEPTTGSTRAETDGELRTRAKHFLHGSERATLGALHQVFARQGVKAEIEEDTGEPGLVRVIPFGEHIDPDTYQRLVTAVAEVRPAGIRVELGEVVVPRAVDLSLLLTTDETATAQTLRNLQAAVRDAVKAYFEELPIRATGSLNRLTGAILAVDGVEDVRIVRADWEVDGGAVSVLDRQQGVLAIQGSPTRLGELNIADPNLPTTLDVVIGVPNGTTPPDPEAQTQALTAALTALNAANATEQPPTSSVGFLELLRTLVLPDIADMSAADLTTIQPYRVRFTVAQVSGVTRVLVAGTDAYEWTPFERLTLGLVQLEEVTE